MKVNRIRQNVLPLITALIWGTAFVAQSVGAEYMEPFTFNTLRAVIAFFFLLALCALRRSVRRKIQEDTVRTSWRNLAIGGSCCGAALAIASFFQQKALRPQLPAKRDLSRLFTSFWFRLSVFFFTSVSRKPYGAALC